MQGPVTDQETSGGGAEIIQYLPPVPETSSQVLPDEAIVSATTQPISSPALDAPMDIDAQTTSDNLNTLGSSWDFDTSALPDWDMQLLFDEDGEPILPPLENNDQALSVQDYDFPQSEQDSQMEEQQNYKNPQYGIPWFLMFLFCKQADCIVGSCQFCRCNDTLCTSCAQVEFNLLGWYFLQLMTTN